jgi:hypothetical protein
MIRIIAHGEEILTRSSEDYVGSPMYSIIPGHEAAILAVIGLVIGVWALRRWGSGWERFSVRLTQYRGLDVARRLLVWLLLVAAAIHAGLVLGHEPSGYTVLYALDAALLGYLVRSILAGSFRRWLGAMVLGGSIVGYAISGMGGEPPDQIGLATKLVEILALTIVLAPQGERRWRRLATSTTVVVMTVVVGIGAWAGAFQTGGGHHLGDTPAPGALIPAGEDRPPTRHEIAEADELHARITTAIAPYADPAVAAADGYAVEGMYGTDFHAANEAYQSDGRVLDPERPETLVYAQTERGPVLLGAMFEMEGIGVAGPAPGGPLTVWHAHDHVCFSLVPPALAGLTSPFGTCPIGSITVARTHEMIHVWTIPGAPEPFGDLDDAWLAGHLDALAG